MKRKILVVDDDQKIRTLLKTYLEKNQFEVILAHDGSSFRNMFERENDELSLIVLDVMLPDTDGFSLCRFVRQSSNIPIIMLTASSGETDCVVGLELGADDYMGKPCSPRELLARIKAIQRRVGIESAAAPRYFRFAGYTLDIIERTLCDFENALVPLTGLDFQLLKCFVERPGDVLERNQLHEATRGRDAGPHDRSLDVQISRLRTRLNDDGRDIPLIKSVRGIGYVFSADVRSTDA
ncbi:response regulator [Massilia cavernae]|uniref:DNA-binding response regulator n=1 Tax=Massilia cavernae TaxID=2320864 RepID=A0A418XQP3_9BURK|nr:response regulator transcription factor [Massilia cavernae]RJG14784.1 DNA-binding response regulator [Massilia cavernae]